MKPKIAPFVPALLLHDAIGTISPNSPKLNEAALLQFMAPEFRDSGITVSELKKEYLDICRILLKDACKKG